MLVFFTKAVERVVKFGRLWSPGGCLAPHRKPGSKILSFPVFGKRNLPRTRLYHSGKPIRYALTSLTTRTVRPASVARARRLASSSREPAAASCSAGLLSSLLLRCGARPR
eukprot:scaffold21084_cov60-Phaeocystis_antarctica.AAC.3